MKNKFVKSIIAMCLCSAMLAGCAGSAEVLESPVFCPATSEEPEVGEEAAGSVSGEAGALAPVELSGMYERAAYLADMVYEKNASQNIMVSPLSLDMALGMVSGGANGQTKEELLNYLGTEDYGVFAAQYMEYAKELNADPMSSVKPSHYKMAYEIANSIWVKDDRKLVEDYVQTVEEQYDAQICAVSFEPDQLPQTVDAINSWCKEKTHELIPEVVNEESFSEEAVAVLVNSLYFESPWTDKWGTTTHSFTDFDGNMTEQEMLCDTLTAYYENENATAFSKSYRNGMRFVGILPKETGEFSLADLDVESLLASETSAYDVQALMPKLDFETTADNVVDILKAQGVETVFDKEQSDMTGFIEMESNEITYISDIIQKTKIELDEEGTKAAAVTAITMDMCTTAMPEQKEIKQVYLDRPFAFLIYDEANEQIVFMGKVVSL